MFYTVIITSPASLGFATYLPTAVISAQVLVFWDLQMTWPLVCTHMDRNTYISSTIFLSGVIATVDVDHILVIVSSPTQASF